MTTSIQFYIISTDICGRLYVSIWYTIIKMLMPIIIFVLLNSMISNFSRGMLKFRFTDFPKMTQAFTFGSE